MPTLAGLYDGTQKVEVFFYAFSAASGEYSGFSSVANLMPAVAGSGAPVPSLFGTGPGQINDFVIVTIPEPSTYAIGGLGMATLWLFRRRK